MTREVTRYLERQFRTIHGSRYYHAARLIPFDDGRGFRDDSIDLRFYSCGCQGCLGGVDCLLHREWERKSIIPL